MSDQELSPLVKALRLEPNVEEGGWYRETWVAPLEIPQTILGERYSGPRQSATAIYYLLHPGEISRWHTVGSEELWMWQSGGPITLTLGGTGEKPEETETITLGPNVLDGQHLQALVPATAWQTARPASDQPALVTCVVAPGFHIDDFKTID